MSKCDQVAIYNPNKQLRTALRVFLAQRGESHSRFTRDLWRGAVAGIVDIDDIRAKLSAMESSEKEYAPSQCEHRAQ